MASVIQKNLTEIEQGINSLCNSNYDVEKLTFSLVHQVKQLEYFYCHVSKDKDNSRTNYAIKKRPSIHELAYFNLGRGFPKELMDGHWCYILKDWGTKMLVIPATSIKETEIDNISEYELDINSYDDNIKRVSRLQFSDIRTVDIQRIDLRKSFFKTDEDTIKEIQKKIELFVFI